MGVYCIMDVEDFIVVWKKDSIKGNSKREVVLPFLKFYDDDMAAKVL